MKIAFNPSTVAALITPPNNKDITFDLRGRNIFARGVKFCGTDTWRDIKINNVSIGSNILDLRNGSNTTLTNTNGVVTINSTWRPVVDNLTSDSTTSSLSANQGRVLKALIDGKSDSGHTHDDRYLKLTGGTMASNALITFADSGSYGTDKGPQGARGGLYWTGQSDYAKLYAEETAGDNLDLVIQFGDDNSNGLSIRNKANTQTSYISSSGVITTGTFKGNLDWSYITNKPATATRWPSWAEVTGKPSSFTPSTHTHGLSNSVFFLNMPSISGNAKWKEVFGYPVNYNLLLSVRINSPAPEWCVGNYGSGILYGGSDTKGFMSSAYNEPLIMWAGGNGSSDDSVPKWYIGIKGIHKSIYNLATIASEANAAYNLRHSHANKSVLDGITSALVNNWNTAFTFVNTITGTDTDKVINKWDEIVNFLAGITEDNKLNTLLNSKLSVYELANNTNVGAIKNNGIYYSTSDASSGTLVNSPFNTGFSLINMTSLDNGDDLRRSRLAFNAYGEIKVSDDRDYANTAETWYNVLTSKNSGISGSTIKLNGTSITVYSSSTADGRYVKKSGDTMSGALNFANNTWNKVGDDSYVGDCNVSGHFGIKAANTTYPGIAFFNNANDHLGNLTAYNGNIKYGAYSLQFLDNGNTSVSASTWTNPFNDYNSNAVADGQAVCVWGQSSYLGNLANDTGDMSLWLKRVNANVATLNMVLDGEYYANGNLRLAHVSEIPTSLKNPHALTISLNGTSQGPYDGSAVKSINITPSSIGAATSGHNHDSRYVRYYAVTTLDCNNLAPGLTAVENTATNSAVVNHSAFLYISDVGTPFQIQIPDSDTPYIFKRSYSSGKWGSWFKLKAGYADSAGSVAWDNVTGKPSSYTPSAHTHDDRYIKKVGDMPTNAYDLIITPTNLDREHVIDSGGGIHVKAHTGTPFQLWLHDTSNVWYKKTGNGAWIKMDAGYADNADMLDGVHANGLFTALSNSNNGISITVGGTTKSVSNISVNYAGSAGNADTLDGIDSTGFLRYYNSNSAPSNVDIVNTPSYVWTVSTTGGSVANATKPSGMNNAWGVIHLHTHIGNYATQLGFGGTTGRMYMRNAYDTSTFGNWQALAFITDIPTSLPANGGNADTVDGYHETAFPRLVGIKGNTWNWNDVIRAGYYKIQSGTITNHPSGIYPFGMAEVITTENHNDGENRELQIYYPHSQTNNIAIWLRMHNSSTQGNGWGSWVGVPNTNGNIASATKLQTARSIWGHSFNGTADVNGTIYINNSNSSEGAIRLNNNVNSNARISAIDDQVIFNTGNAIRFGGTSWDWNVWAGLKYTHSNKTIYLGIADNSIFNANSALSGGSLRFPGISNVYATTFNGSLSGNASSATTLQTTRTLWGQSFNGSNNVSGNMSGVGLITFSALSGINGRALLYLQMADNDFFRIYVGGTASNSGYVEIATADDGTEPIYVRQYTGVFSSVKRTLTLLDANGYTHFPSYINIGGNENNNSSPDRVWGSNSSDSYLRSYRTSALRVSYANSAGNADLLDGYHADNIQSAGWRSLYRTGGDPYQIKWTRIGRCITTANDNAQNDGMIEFHTNGDLNYKYFGYGRLQISQYGQSSRSLMLQSFTSEGIHFYATIDADNYIWLGHNAWWSGNSAYRVIWSGSYIEWYSSGMSMQTSNPNSVYVTDNGTFKKPNETGFVYLNNVSTGYASSATKVIVNLHTANDTNYPLVWSNLNNSNTVTENLLFKSWSDLYYNPKNKRLTVGGSIYAAHFYESSDKVLKKNIKSILSSTNIPKIREFDWKDTGEHSYGFIALELEELGYSCLVNEANGKKTVNYTATLALTVAKLLNLINIQNKKISNLTKELKALKYGRKKNS